MSEMDDEDSKIEEIMMKVENYINSQTTNEDEEDLTPMERERQKNIAFTKKLMEELGLNQAKEELFHFTPQPPKAPKTLSDKKRKRHSYGTPVEYRPYSLRSKGSLFKDESPVHVTFSTPKEEKPLGPVLMKMEEEEDGANWDSLLDGLRKDFAGSKGNVWEGLDPCSSDIAHFTAGMNQMRLLDDTPKVLNTRIQSLFIHPSQTKKLVVAGGSDGSIGLWDIDAGSDMGLVEFSPHSRAVNCLSVLSTDPAKMFSTSHDGTVRCADINKARFDVVYATDRSIKNSHLTWHCEFDPNSLLVAHGCGKVGLVDLRQEGVLKTWQECHPRSVRTVQLHPTNQNYFLTSSGTGECKIFDARKIDKKGRAVCALEHAKGLTSAFFSANGNHIVTTCNDDQVYIYTSANITQYSVKVLQSITHNNHTGRWLSVFKAMWYPGRDDCFFIGSLLQPRRISFYGLDGKVFAVLSAEQMSTIQSLIAVHPTLPLIAGGNSTGRVHIYTKSL